MSERDQYSENLDPAEELPADQWARKWAEEKIRADRMFKSRAVLITHLRMIIDYGDTGSGGRPAFHDMRALARKALVEIGVLP